MLKFLGKRKRSRKILLLFFVGALGVGLVGFFMPGNFSALNGAPDDDTVIATVGRYDITLKDLKERLTLIGQQAAQGQGAMRRDDLGTLYSLYGENVIDELVRQKVIQYEADQLSFFASDSEVQDYIRSLPSFKPWPGAQGYRLFLQQNGMTPFQFEDSIRASLAEQKLRSFVTAAVQVSAAEIEEEYRREKTNYQIRSVEVDPEKLRTKVVVADPDLRAFFEQRKSDFHIDAEQRRARYIFIDQNKAGETISVSDDELKQDFNPERGVQQVRVSQIVLNVPKVKPAPADQASDQPKPDPAQPVREKANDLVSRARGTGGKPPEDFAKLAREASEDANSKTNGGDIGWVNKKDKRDTDDPLNTVFSMQKGDVSQPTRKGDKFYILKVTDRKLPTFEESREQLLKEARARKGYTKAVEIGTDAEQKFKGSKDAEAVAAELNATHKAQVASVRETPFFAQGDNIPNLGAAPDFQSSLFALQNIGDITERLNVNNGFAIAQYLEKRDPHEPAFDEVKTKVEERYRQEKAKEMAAELARKLAEARSPEALKAIAGSMRIKTDERSGIGDQSVGPLVSEASRSQVYKLDKGQVTREPIKGDDGDVLVVAALIDKSNPDMGEGFQKARKSIEDRQRDARAAIIYSSFVSAAEKRLKDAGKVEVHLDLINRAMKGSTEAIADRPGGTPRPRPRRTPPVR